MIPGIVLAAGRSTRMGRPKALLPDAGGEAFLARLVRALLDGGVREVTVVVHGGAEGWLEQAGWPASDRRARTLVNPRADEGQLSSLLAGLEAVGLERVLAVLVAPVDVPLSNPATVATLLDAARQRPGSIVRPTFRGRHGHPVIFPRELFGELREADPALGARVVVRRHAASVRNVEVDDPGVVADLDTPEEYAAWLDGRL